MFGRFPVYHTHRVRETVLFLFPYLESLVGRPLLLILTGFVAGLLLRHSSSEPCISAGVFLLLSACGLLVAPRRSLLAALIPMGALAGYALMSPWAEAHNTPREFPSSPCTISGNIEHLETREQDLRCILRDVRFAEGHGLPSPVSGIRLLIKGGAPLTATEGMGLTTTCRLRPFSNFNNPGRFDYRGHMIRRGIGAWAVVKSADIAFLPAAPSQRWRTTLHGVRRHIETALFTHAPTPRSAALLSALITGNRSHIKPSLRDLFTETGTAHLLAISGLHLGLVTALFFFLFKHVLSFWERPLIKGHTQILAAAATIVPVLLYGLLSGMAPSTQRALIAACLVLGALAFHEEADLPTTLALAGLIILIVHPPALFTISFQLSFAAVAAILASLAQLRRPTGLLSPPTLNLRILTFLIPPCFASFGTAPLIWYHFGYATPIGLLANLVMVPATSFAVVLPGLLGVVLLPLCPPLSGPLFYLAGAAAEGVIQMASHFATVPGGFLTLPRPGLTTVLLVLGLFFSLLLSRKGKRKGPVVVAFLCLILLGGKAGRAILTRHHNPSFEVTVLDVGHGAAVVLAFPNGKRWLVDGGFAWPGRYDAGRFAVAPYLQDSQITTLDAVVLTHPESDHMGGLIHILKRFTVKTIITGPRSGQGVLWNRFSEAARRQGSEWIHLNADAPPMDVEGVRVTCLHPGPASSGFTGKGAVNNNSLVLKMRYGAHQILLSGDIMSEAESQLATQAGIHLRSDVLVVPHHGSATSSSPDFLAHVRPSLAVVSTGHNNRYGLPHEEVLTRYEKAGCPLYRTDRDGAVTITSDGATLSVSTFQRTACNVSTAVTSGQP